MTILQLRLAPLYFLDNLINRIQKFVGPLELEPGSTSPRLFVLFTAVQIAFWLVATKVLLPAALQYVGCNDQIINSQLFFHFALASYALHVGGWLISVLVFKSHKWFDVIEDVGLWVLIFVLYYKNIIDASSSSTPPPAAAVAQQHLVFIMALTWCSRLVAFLLWRICVRGRDWRFDKLASEPCYALFAWVSGGTWCLLVCSCLLVTAAVTASPKSATTSAASASAASSVVLSALFFTTPQNVLGVALVIVGLVIEQVADSQKSVFNKKFKSGTNPNWIDSGLWRYSRHPNYFGEAVVWVGLALLAHVHVVSSSGAVFANTNKNNSTATSSLMTPLLSSLSWVSPVWAVIFLAFTSLMLLEKRGDQQWGYNERYLEYKRRTAVFLLLPRKF